MTTWALKHETAPKLLRHGPATGCRLGASEAETMGSGIAGESRSVYSVHSGMAPIRLASAAEGRTTVAVTEHGRETDHVPGRHVGGHCTPSVVSSHMGLADCEECGRGGMAVVGAWPTVRDVVV